MDLAAFTIPLAIVAQLTIPPNTFTRIAFTWTQATNHRNCRIAAIQSTSAVTKLTEVTGIIQMLRPLNCYHISIFGLCGICTMQPWLELPYSSISRVIHVIISNYEGSESRQNGYSIPSSRNQWWIVNLKERRYSFWYQYSINASVSDKTACLKSLRLHHFINDDRHWYICLALCGVPQM